MHAEGAGGGTFRVHTLCRRHRGTQLPGTVVLNIKEFEIPEATSPVLNLLGLNLGGAFNSGCGASHPTASGTLTLALLSDRCSARTLPSADVCNTVRGNRCFNTVVNNVVKTNTRETVWGPIALLENHVNRGQPRAFPQCGRVKVKMSLGAAIATYWTPSTA